MLDEWCAALNIDHDEVAFIGDDLNDRDIIEVAGVSACPANAAAAIREVCDVVLENNGGHDAVREFLDRFYFDAN